MLNAFYLIEFEILVKYLLAYSEGNGGLMSSCNKLIMV